MVSETCDYLLRLNKTKLNKLNITNLIYSTLISIKIKSTRYGGSWLMKLTGHCPL